MAYGDLKRRTASDKSLRNKAFNIVKNPVYDGYQRGLASMVYKFFDKKSASLTDKSVSGSGIVNNNNNNDNNNKNNNNDNNNKDNNDNNDNNNDNNDNNNDIKQNYQLANKLHKPVIRKF